MDARSRPVRDGKLQCPDCLGWKYPKEFSLRNKKKWPTRRVSYCKKCYSLRSNGWRKRNLEKSRKYQREYQRKNKRNPSHRLFRNRRLVYEYLQDNPCETCGEANPACLQFHHRDPKHKLFGIGTSKGKPFADLIIEINKCQILCANCHFKITAKESGWYSWLTV